MIQRRVFVSGKVQGVSFRAYTSEEARKYSGLRGFVRNLSDGRVEAVFCGEQSAVLAMVAWCKTGSPHGKVTKLEVIEEAVDASLGEFKIER